MSIHYLKNNELCLCIDTFGAELKSIQTVDNSTEYLWSGNPLYWKRNSPVLFPIVGSLKNQSYIYKNKSYHMSQHGFARDMEFKLTEVTETEIWFQLTATEATKKVYPFNFTLDIGYRLRNRQITVLWKVKNSGTDTMYFSIGAHPAFLCPLRDEDNQTDYFLQFDSLNPLNYLLINQEGLAVKEQPEILNTENGMLSIRQGMFDKDALIFENNQSHKISLTLPNKKPYITVSFEAPLFGLWSPAGKNAPFICIEPWYGRCDSSHFNGSLEEREWGNVLDAGKIFSSEYTIDIH
ncbi:aldose 1-epimerase family protein [Anaerocolumna cellulosilytica]|nr:aldose 1-epimerase family protein [Anaerocolumna cellulosilytica]MBB5194227.1 galactose mutarotase-like enzyme [Anaerocolumna cellulosilytica]